MENNLGKKVVESSPFAESASRAEARSRIPRSVNLHLTHRCNLSCRFCYQTEQGHLESLAPEADPVLSKSDQLRLQVLLAEAGVQRVTYAGGEPTLIPHLEELANNWHRLTGGLEPTAMVVTNGAALYEARVRRMLRALAAVKLSADSPNDATEAALGRGSGDHVRLVIDRADMLRSLGVRVDLNSVVTYLNWQEDLTPLVRRVAPTHWKAFQFLPVPGQNDADAERLRISKEQFEAFLARHSHLRDVLVPEDNDLMRGSYAMVDPVGRVFQSTPAGYSRSRHSILEVGVEAAFADVRVDWAKYDRRGGDSRAFGSGGPA